MVIRSLQNFRTKEQTKGVGFKVLFIFRFSHLLTSVIPNFRREAGAKS